MRRQKPNEYLVGLIPAICTIWVFSSYFLKKEKACIKC